MQKAERADFYFRFYVHVHLYVSSIDSKYVSPQAFTSVLSQCSKKRKKGTETPITTFP